MCLTEYHIIMDIFWKSHPGTLEQAGFKPEMVEEKKKKCGFEKNVIRF